MHKHKLSEKLPAWDSSSGETFYLGKQTCSNGFSTEIHCHSLWRFAKLFDVKTERIIKNEWTWNFSNIPCSKLWRKLKNVSRPWELLLYFTSVPFVRRRSRLANSFWSLCKFLLPSVLELFHNFVFRVHCKLWVNFAKRASFCTATAKIKSSTSQEVFCTLIIFLLVEHESCVIWHGN